jgi:hypothetical protein
MPSIRFLPRCLALVLAFAAGASLAGQSELAIQAYVPKRVKLEVLSQPGTLTVTAEDVRRGYVEAPVPVQVAVKANTDQYAIVFSGAGDVVRQAQVQGLDGLVQFDGTGAMVPQRVTLRPSQQKLHELRFRFMLAANTAPGAHPWPLQVSAMPL